MRIQYMTNYHNLRKSLAVNLIGRLLAALLVLVSADTWAVGLGKMRVLSALDQPLEAEIELLSTTPAELNTLEVGLGSRSDFTRAGVERSSLLSLVKLETQVREDGDAFIRLTTDDPVTEPFLHFLVAIEWAGGKLIREYTALLDPPLYAQGRPASVSSPRVAGADPAGSTIRQGQPQGQQPSAEPLSPARLAAQAAARPARGGPLYGPIRRGETLSDIVAGMNLPQGVDVFQAMIALLQRNPEAFILGNINLVKEGSTMVLPTGQEMAAISKVVASAEYSKHLNEWLAYRNRVAGSQLAAGTPAATPSALPSDDGSVRAEPTGTTRSAAGAPAEGSGLSEDVLRIIQSDDGTQAAATASGDSEEVGALKSQLAVMEESLLSTELENKELRERLAMLEEQIKETNKLLRLENPGLALAEQSASADRGSSGAAGAGGADNRAGAGDAGARATSGEDSAAAPAGASQVRVTSSTSLLEPLNEILRGDMLWKVLLALAAIVLLIGIVVYIRRRQSYAEFEETMMTGSTYDMRSQSSAFTQVPRMDSSQQSRHSTRADSQQSGSLMQTSFMSEMGAPGMGAMQADEVDPVAEAEVYMAYGRDQQAMEVLQDAIRRDPSRVELKLKLLEVYQKRKDVRAFESLAEELYPAIGKDASRWGRVAEMGRRISPRHPLFAGGGSGTTTIDTHLSSREASGVDRDSGSLDLISAPFSRANEFSPRTEDSIPLDLPSTGRGNLEAGADQVAPDDQRGIDVDTDSVSLPFGGGLGTPSTPSRSFAEEADAFGAEPIDDFKASEIATKLDLAKAYLEMGDKDAARGFIEEVLKEGNEAQRQQASELASSF